MYSAVLLAALTAGSTAPNHCFRGGCYYAPTCYGCYRCGGGFGGCYGCGGSYGYGCYGGCYGCYGGCYGCGGCSGYGCSGPGYGYHGGCYGGYGMWYNDPSFFHGVSCYGCHGGYSCYGVALPVPVTPRQPEAKDLYPPINPPKKDVKDGKQPEEIGSPKEKKIDVPKVDKDLPKKGNLDGKQQSRAKVIIDVPVGGQLFVDGHRIQTPAGRRDFQTPILEIGQPYYYDIRIEVARNGQVVSDQRRVILQAGQQLTVAFPNLTPGGTVTAQANE